MKRHAFDDAWRHLQDRKYPAGVAAISITNLDGLHDFSEPISGSVNAICGFNGAGKTTILSCIRDAIMGQKGPVQDRIARATMSMQIRYRGETQEIKKEAGQAFPLIPENPIEVISIDTGTQVPRLQAFFRAVTNIEEELKQHESINLADQDRQLLNFLVGREYENITITELTDDYADENGKILDTAEPLRELVENRALTHFKVKIGGLEYSVEAMGLGELALIHIFWKIFGAKRGSAVLLEEPESFIATASQVALIDVIAYFAEKKNLWVCIATHSEHILGRIPEGDIFALTRETSGKHTVRRNVRRDEHLAQLRLMPRFLGCMFCEDWVGVTFAKRLLELEMSSLAHCYQFLPLFGESKIEQMLQTYPKERSMLPICGIFDGDIRTKPNFPRQPVWPSTFLPGTRPPEEMLILYARTNPDNMDHLLALEPGSTSRVLGTLEGLDFHDQLSDLSKRVDRSISWIITVFAKDWYSSPDNRQETAEFCASLARICDEF